MSERIKIPAAAMQPGDVVGSGETVERVSAPYLGKVEVVLSRGERRRTATWGARTLIGVTRS